VKRIYYYGFILCFVVVVSSVMFGFGCEAAKKSSETENTTETEQKLSITSPSAILMELNTGTVLYEKDADAARRPASVTKVMTMLLAFEALEQGKLQIQDMVVVSENAASMGGSQVFLEVGEEQSFEDLLKSMIISSANDAATAVGECIAGSEEQFVALMNHKAQELGMKNSHFENACGLEAEGHKMSARDIGILSRTLLLKYPKVTEYTTIWMDHITHKTKKGESEFGLANTNKFLKKYNGANGLKTGYTSAAGYSMSATATRDHVTLIAVVMGSKTKEERYSDAAKLLDYGFANCNIYEDLDVLDGKQELPIQDGERELIKVKAEQPFRAVLMSEETKDSICKTLEYDSVVAPIKKGQRIAWMQYAKDGKCFGKVAIIADEDMEKRRFGHTFIRVIKQYIHTN